MVSIVRKSESDHTVLLHKETINILKAKILLGLKEFTIDIPIHISTDWRGEKAINLAKLGVKSTAFSHNNERQSTVMHIFMK